MNRFSDKIPTVLDTDIGTDFDDTWALAMLLRCPELDPRLVVTASGDTTYRAEVAAAVLASDQQEKIPIGIGPVTEIPPDSAGRPQQLLADTVDLARYGGKVLDGGVEELVKCIMDSDRQVTVVAIGPLTNVAAALELEPRIVENARLVAMLGSIRRGNLDAPRPEVEYNVVCDIPACRKVLAADWEVTITPLDTCGSVVLRDDLYSALQSSSDPLIQTVMNAYREWVEAWAPELDALADEVHGSRMYERNTSVLYDTVAIYLAYDESLVKIEELPLAIDDEGWMRITPGSRKVRVATSWRDDSFPDQLVDRLVSGRPPQ